MVRQNQQRRNHDSCQLTAIGDHDSLFGLSGGGAIRFNRFDDIHTITYAAKDNMLAVQPFRLDGAKEECDPLVFGPALAIDKIPGPVCFSLKFSSGNLFP